jgi:hypothetical protein
MFLTHEFVVFGITFQNWMVVLAIMVLLFLLYFWIMSRRNSR